MRRRLQESFRMSTGGGPGGILSNGGFMASLTGNGSGQSHIPSISVSVQTEPIMMSSSMLANGGQTVLSNGGGGGMQANGVNTNGNTNRSNAPAIMALHHHSATLPHHSAISKRDLAIHQGGTPTGLIGRHLGSGVNSGKSSISIVLQIEIQMCLFFFRHC